MRLFLLTCFLAYGLTLSAQEDYVVHLNDTTFELALDKEYEIYVDGNAISFMVRAKDTLTHDEVLYSFKHSKDYKVSKILVDEGIDQIMIMTAEGSGMIIQQYTTVNPSMLNEMMITEITKESVSYGFTLDRQDYERKLSSGQKIDVDKAVLEYKDEVNIYEVASIGDKDEGIMIMTMRMDDLKGTEGQKIIDLMWDTLIYK